MVGQRDGQEAGSFYSKRLIWLHHSLRGRRRDKLRFHQIEILPMMPPMIDQESGVASPRRVAFLAATTVALLWLAQPPLALWPCALIALTPLLWLAQHRSVISRAGWSALWGVSVLYWLLSLQGLRHAHPLMCVPWAALSLYLGVYHVLFVVCVRAMLSLRVPLLLAAPIAWVGQECIRNYLLTGISAVMLGHAMADVPRMTQIADLGGTYAVSFLVCMINVAAFALARLVLQHPKRQAAWIAVVTTAVVVTVTLSYGSFRLSEPVSEGSTSFALIQRSEPVEYQQSYEREAEIFQNYARQSVEALRTTSRSVDAIVWPESMFSGGQAWMMAGPDAIAPPQWRMGSDAFQAGIRDRQEYFRYRTRQLQAALAAVNESSRSPHLLVGCGVVDYQDQPYAYSSVLSIDPDGKLAGWYGKTHLVMFGEYIPIAPAIPGLKRLIPPGMGLATGSGATLFEIGQATVSPNICIETAVERVVVSQMHSLRSRDALPDVIVTVTNDGWFDQSSVIAHHRRCAQLVAVGCRRPLLSAANNGPTAWIDSCGRIVRQLPVGSEGAIIAKPRQDQRSSFYVRIGDWPAWLCTAFSLLAIVIASRTKRASNHTPQQRPGTDSE